MPQFAPIPGGALDQWTLVLGFLMPNLVALINQSHWSAKCKAAVGALTCLVAAVIELSLKGQLDATNLTVSFLAILALSISFFKGFWRPLGVSGPLEEMSDLPRADKEPTD